MSGSRFAYDSNRSTSISGSVSDDELRRRIGELRGYDRLSRAQSDELRDYEHHLAERERQNQQARLERAAGLEPGTFARAEEAGEPVRPSSISPAAVERPGLADYPAPARRDDSPGARSRDLARKAIEAAHREQGLPDYAAERAERLVTDGPLFAQQAAARWATVTGDPAYRTAFAKKLADPDGARDLWTDAERDAWRKVAELQSEQRAMGISTGGAGGFMVPLTLDPSILLTSDGSTNPLRQVSRVVQTSTDSWNGISSAGVSAEWKAEAAEAAEASPSLAQPSIPVHFGDAFTPFSFEVGMDALGFLGELQRVLLDAADQLQAEAFMTGSGSGEPTGIVTALPAGSKVATAAADTLAVDDVVGLQNALPPRFQPNAQFLANLTTINDLGSFETGNGALRFPEVNNGRLLRKPLTEASHLDAVGDTAAAGNDNVLLYGDFKQFVIVDRIGTTMELVPHLFGANRRPTGQRGALLWFRTGSDVVVPQAFRLLTA